MEQSTPRTVAATSWLLRICLVAAVFAGVRQACAQPDSIGFISVDCGLPGTANSVDDTTKLSYAPDAAFTDAGTSSNISAQYITPKLAKRFYNVRSFPARGGAARSCYTLRSLVAGLKYLVRAEFKYGNYDGIGRLPIAFDLYVGVNFWRTVNVSSPEAEMTHEAIVVVPDEFVQVCLVNTGSGTPFISALELRPLKSSIYPYANATQGLVLVSRVNFGPGVGTDIVRYPDDPHDRVWWPWMIDASIYAEISTTSRVLNTDNDLFEAPSKVMQTAIAPRSNASRKIVFSWDSESLPMDLSLRYILVLYFSELQVLRSNASRQFYINLNGELWFPAYTPPYLVTGQIYSINPMWGFDEYKVSIDATANSTLPPIINAFEIFSVMSTINVGTDSQDVSAISAIKVKYGIQKNWMGDPCVPKTLAWDGLTCSYAILSPPRVTSVNISFSGLNGDISSSFAALKSVQHLDLSHNNLTGSIPDALSQLPSLKVLDLTSNQLNGSIPPGLLKRIQDGSLTIQYGNNPNLCTSADTCQTKKGKSKLAVYIAAPVVLVVVVGILVTLFCFFRRKKQGSKKNTVKPQNEMPASQVRSPQGDVYPQSTLQLENRRFTFKELVMITNNFQHVLGQGGFGKVYDGFLENGTPVAVKLRSQSSNQGVKEFLSEAQILTRIHHKNLVSMIGYCKDGQYMALVYEYMSEGTLQRQIAGNGRNGRCLTWRQRLRIALDSAQGLEYLHKGCNPPLIHRDVKATNILLDAKLEAKIADFGFSKAFNRDKEAQIVTNTLVGTPGYVDPEYVNPEPAIQSRKIFIALSRYQATLLPTTKSDVYSFGVVVLELVTGRPAILSDPKPTSIVQLVRKRLARGNIEDVVDARMHGEYDVNSVWKAADIALKCTMQVSAQRPTMTDVVAQLQECLELEERRCTEDGTRGSFDTGSSLGYAHAIDSQATDMSQVSTGFEMFGKAPRMGRDPVAR